MNDLDQKLEAFKCELWFRGRLRHLTRPGPQRDAYDMIHSRDKAFSAFSPFVFNFHRRLGKTFLAVLLSIECCLRAYGRFVKFAAPSLTQAADILEEHWAIIMQECPPELEPKPYKNEKFTFRNPRWGDNKFFTSILRLYGVQNDRGNKMRGGSCDMAILDEVREFTDLRYTWGSVLLPQFKGRKEPLSIMISTPPDSMDHDFCSVYVPQAKERGKYRCIPGSQDPNWTKEEDEMFAREMGGRDTPMYRREIECELISDGSHLIIPEFSRVDMEDSSGRILNEYVAPRRKPQHYIAVTMGDMGGAGKSTTDRAGIIAGWIDFQDGLFHQARELFVRDLDTAGLANAWKMVIDSLFAEDLESGRCRRLDVWCDTTEQQVVDFRRLCNLEVRNIPKTDKEAARRKLRTDYITGKWSIDPSCKETIYQLRNGGRTQRGEFQRSERLGHCDCVAAQIGVNRVLDFETCPTPDPVYDRESYFVPPEGPQKGNFWGDLYKRRGR